MQKNASIFFFISVLFFIILLLPLSVFASGLSGIANTSPTPNGYKPITVDEQKKICLTFSPPISSSNANVQQLLDMTVQVSAIYSAAQQFYLQQSVKKIPIDKFNQQITQIDELKKTTISWINSTSIDIANFSCKNDDLFYALQNIQLSFSQSVASYKTFKASVKDLLTKIKISLQTSSASPTATITPKVTKTK